MSLRVRENALPFGVGEVVFPWCKCPLPFGEEGPLGEGEGRLNENEGPLNEKEGRLDESEESGIVFAWIWIWTFVESLR